MAVVADTAGHWARALFSKWSCSLVAKDAPEALLLTRSVAYFLHQLHWAVFARLSLRLGHVLDIVRPQTVLLLRFGELDEFGSGTLPLPGSWLCRSRGGGGSRGLFCRSRGGGGSRSWACHTHSGWTRFDTRFAGKAEARGSGNDAKLVHLLGGGGNGFGVQAPCPLQSVPPCDEFCTRAVLRVISENTHTHTGRSGRRRVARVCVALRGEAGQGEVGGQGAERDAP